MHCSRKQFRLRLAYAVLGIHKSHGMTLRKVVIELGLSDFCHGLSFVAISRVRAITDIVFLNQIIEQRLKRVAVDLHRRQQLPFHDEGLAEELGYRFND
jgi:ATP-dependent exoDNAse (exonuclease V) alpha subunit